jgi:thioredoxin reductase
MARWVIAVAICVLGVAVSPLQGQEGAPSAHQEQGGPAGASHAPHGPMPKPVNLKVLPKDISGEDLMKVMHSYSVQLGVKCNFCHVGNAQTKQMNFASDEKPEKNTARTMIAMTDEMNAKYLSQIHDPDAKPDQKIVTCGTCHRGQNMPAVFKAPEGPKAEQKH